MVNIRLGGLNFDVICGSIWNANQQYGAFNMQYTGNEPKGNLSLLVSVQFGLHSNGTSGATG